jgi:two-component system OmpR family response regulator
MTTPASKGRRVLVVDDEANIAELVATALRYEGFEVRTAADGASALAAVRDLAPDLVVLDVMLPDADGFDLQARIRADGQHVPVLFLTARDAVEDRVRGLTLGADDYMTKPFSLEELVARVHAVLRRTSGADAISHRLSFSDLELDEETREVRRGERRIDLSPTEFSLLRYLLLNSRKVLSKAQILDHVWQYDFGGDGPQAGAMPSALTSPATRARRSCKPGTPTTRSHRGRGSESSPRTRQLPSSPLRSCSDGEMSSGAARCAEIGGQSTKRLRRVG